MSGRSSWKARSARGAALTTLLASTAFVLAALAGGGVARADAAPANGAGPASRDGGELFRAAGEAYEAGKYDEAARGYEALLFEGYDDPRIEYNLGNARFKQGRLGPAILAYERALAADPSDADARENLSYANLLIADKVGTVEEEFPAAILGWLEREADRAVLWLAVAASLAGLIGMRLWFDPPPAMRRFLRAALGVLIPAALVLSGAAAIGIARPGRSTYAIVLADTVDGRSAPATSGTVLFTVHEGLKVELRGDRPGWLQVTLPNGLTGWIEQGKAERI